MLLAGAAAAGPAACQTGRVGAEVGYSHSFPPAGSPLSAADYLEGGVDLSLPVGAVELFGRARGGWTPAGESAGDWVTGAAGGRWMAPLGGGAAAGGTVLARAFHVAGPTRYSAVTGRVRPELRWRSHPVTVRLRGRGAVGRTQTAVEPADGPGPPGPPGPGSDAATLVTADVSNLGADARLEVETAAGTVWLSGRQVEADAGTYRAAGVGGAVSTGALRIRARAGYWRTPAGDEWSGGLTVSVPLSGGWSASGSGGRRPPLPLLGAPASVDLSASVRREIPLRAGEVGPAVYEVGEAGGSGPSRPVTFRLRRPAAEEAAVVGSFTGWRPVPMERSGGAWTARIEVTPGVHHFGFRVDGRWVVPERAPGVVSDQWGRENATLVVPEGDA